ncbi:MAG: hypothetical protein ACIARR_01130 [Phycisphaerales bacterium JB059]
MRSNTSPHAPRSGSNAEDLTLLLLVTLLAAAWITAPGCAVAAGAAAGAGAGYVAGHQAADDD